MLKYKKNLRGIMTSFTTAKRGYLKKEVDEFIKQSHLKNESILRELKKNIDSLCSENEMLKKQLLIYKEKEDSINRAIICSQEKAKQVEISLYKTIKLELERLSHFQAKWTDFIEKKLAHKDLSKYKITLMEYLSNARSEIECALKEHFNFKAPLSPMEEQYVSESRRLSSLSYKKDIYSDNEDYIEDEESIEEEEIGRAHV